MDVDTLCLTRGPQSSGFQDLRAEGALKPGDMAVDFTLEPRGGGPAVSLSSFRGRSPVALVFGSYT